MKKDVTDDPINDEDVINNLDFLIDIAKDEYDVFFKRSQTLDTKVGVIITVIGAVCAYVLDIGYLNQLINNLTIYNYLEFLLYIGLLGIFIAILILTSNIIITKKTSFMPLNAFNKNLFEENKTKELKSKILLNSYKKLLEDNDVILRKKNKNFNAICILSIIEIGIVIVLQLLKLTIV